MNPLVPLLLLNGAPVEVSPGLVVALEAVPAALLPVGVPAGTYVSFVNAAREAVQGTMLAVAAALGGVPLGTVDSAGYGPVFTASGGGVVGGFGTWRAHRIQSQVILEGAISFSPAVPGVAELVTFTLPPGVSFQPTAPFANVYDLSGSVSLSNPAASTATLPQATVAALTGESNINCAGPSENFAFTFSYSAV